MQTESLAPWEKSALNATARLLIQAVGGYDVAEMIAGRKRAALHGYTDLASDSFMPVDVVARLEREAVAIGAKPLVSPNLARLVGYLQVPVPPADGEVGQAAAAVLRQTAELAARHMEAASDGQVTEAERADVAAQVDRLIDVAMRLRAVLAAPEGRRA